MRGANAAKKLDIIDGENSLQVPFDLDFLARQTLGDPGLEIEVLRMFEQISQTYFQRIESSTNVDDLVRNLHTLRGASAGVGAMALAEAARIAEVEARERNTLSPERLRTLSTAMQDVSTFIAGRVIDGEA